MTDIRVGDRVRLTAEGVVEAASGGLIRIGRHHYNPAFHEVEVIEPRKPQVGDIVSGEELDSLPVGAVVRSLSPGTTIRLFKTRHGWRDSTCDATYDSRGLTDRREVVYLP